MDATQLKQNANTIDARVQRIKNRRLFVTPKRVPRQPLVTLPALDESEPPRVGKVERSEDDSVWIWMHDFVKVPSRGRRVGNIDRKAPLVLVEVSRKMFKKLKAYRDIIFSRLSLSPYEGMSINGKNITYMGAGHCVESAAAQKYDHRGKCGGFGADSDDAVDEGNFAEDFAGGGGAFDQAWTASERFAEKGGVLGLARAAGENHEAPSWDSFLEAALTDNAKTNVEEAREAYENLQALVGAPSKPAWLVKAEALLEGEEVNVDE